MFYIIETESQLEQFSTYDLEKCFLEVVTNNDLYHPLLSDVCLIYIKPFHSRAGFILCINHPETLRLPVGKVWKLLDKKTKEIYVPDGKKMRYFPLPAERLRCLKTAYWLENREIPSSNKNNTAAHDFFIKKFPYNFDINRLIPVSKVYEKFENFFQLKIERKCFESKQYRFYNELAIQAFFEIEKAGIKIDSVSLRKHHVLNETDASVRGERIYTWYNFFTQTGRPTNQFNGINFCNFSKSNFSREFIVCENDSLVEFDYISYHPRILTKWVNYDFPESDIHYQLGKLYFNKDILSEEEYKRSKNITFKYLYTGKIIEKDLGATIDFFMSVNQLKDSYMAELLENTCINSHITGKKIKNIENDVQLLPHLLQTFETERNILILRDLLVYLREKKTKLVLYNFDSFLFDFSKSDGRNTLIGIKKILEEDGFFVSCKTGKNYKELN